MSKAGPYTVLALIITLPLVILSTLTPTVLAQSLTYTYRLDSSGVATVTIIATNLSGLYTYQLRLDRGVIPETVSIVNATTGEPVPTNLTGDVLTIYLMNMTSSVIITYTAVVGNLTAEGYVDAVVSPQGPSNIVLPNGAALLYFNGSPSITMKGSVIVLTYSTAGTYEVRYLLPPPPTTTTTTKPITTTTTTTATTTTTPTKTSTTPTTTKTTTTPKTTTASVTTTTCTTPSTTSTTTTSIKTTLTTSKTSITTATKTTLTTTTKAATHAVTSTKSMTTSLTTNKTITKSTTTPTKSITTTSPATSKSVTTTTTPKPSGPTIPTGLIAGVVAAIVAASIIASLIRRRGARSTQAASVPMEIVKEELDERDAEILKALKEESMNISALAKKLGLSKSVVWRRANKLSRLGLITKVEEGGKVVLRITDEGIRALEELFKGG